MIQYPPLVSIRKIRDLPTTPAVYVALGPQGDVLYVGATKNLRVRIQTHHRWWAMMQADTRLYWVDTPTVEQRTRLEQRWIIQLEPEWNVIVPKDKFDD